MNIFAMVSYMFISCFTPGPNNIMCLNNGTKYGFKKSQPFCWGVGIGASNNMLLAILLNVLLYRFVPNIVNVLTYIGAAYILYLAYVIFRDKPKDPNKKTLETTSFGAAIALQLVNPKGILYNMTLITTFVFPYTKEVHVFVLVLLLSFIMCLASTNCWLLFGTIFKSFFDKYRKTLNIIMSLLLVYCALSFFI